MKKLFGILMIGLAACGPSPAGGPYQATWESLKAHPTPGWFQDAKFGIYTHWGPVTGGAEDGPGGVQWYGCNMYVPDSPTFEYHRKRFGDQHRVGYKDIVGLFKAKKFDADAWAALFAEAGARFAGPVAIHHDNFAMWDSAYTEWDSMDKGPKRDITGELERAIRKRGMKFIATFHHAFSWRYFEPAYPFDGADPNYAGLYCQAHEPDAPPTREFMELWLAKVNEVVTKYEPDLMWFDFGLGARNCLTLQYRQRMFADYYNWAAKKGIEVGVAHKHHDIHQHTGILDFERGREDRLTPYCWLTDTSVGPWFHQKSSPFKTAGELVDVLVDIISKNGCMLLNVGPQADGTIPEQGKQILRGIGAWLKINGEAIYNTRPWQVYGEGPTRNTGGGFSENKDKPYTAQDIRFTRSKDGKTLYVIVLGWPEAALTIQSMELVAAGSNARVELLGHDGNISFSANDEKQLVIHVPNLMPERRPCEHAFAFKLAGFDIALNDVVRFDQPDAIQILPEQATFDGAKVRTQTAGGRPSIGFWDDPAESVHWLVYVPNAGRYQIRGEFSAAYAPSQLTLHVAGQSSLVQIPKTEGWFNPAFVSFGEFSFDSAGVQHLVLKPTDASAWKAVNVYRLQMAPQDDVKACPRTNCAPSRHQTRQQSRRAGMPEG